MKKRTLIIIAGTLAVLGLMFVGGGIWAYSNGYYHALRGGLAQNNGDLDGAIGYFKAAYERNPDAFMVAHDLAGCYALKGDKESCIEWLKVALKSPYGEYARKHAKTEHDFESVRESKEFQSLIEGPAK